jgi:hypothetical protein
MEIMGGQALQRERYKLGHSSGEICVRGLVLVPDANEQVLA